MTLTTKLTLGAVALLIMVMGVVTLRLGCHNDDTPQVTGTDTLPDAVIVKDRPKPPASFGQKIVRHAVPAQISVSQGTPDTQRVSWYADAAHEADSLRHLVDSLKRGDSTDQARAARVAKPRPLLPPVSGSYDGKHLKLYLSRADGSLLRATARLHPHFRFYAGQSARTDLLPAFDEDRWFLRAARQAVKCVPRAAALGGIGGGIGAATRSDNPLRDGILSGSAALLGCLLG